MGFWELLVLIMLLELVLLPLLHCYLTLSLLWLYLGLLRVGEKLTRIEILVKKKRSPIEFIRYEALYYLVST